MLHSRDTATPNVKIVVLISQLWQVLTTVMIVKHEIIGPLRSFQL